MKKTLLSFDRENESGELETPDTDCVWVDIPCPDCRGRRNRKCPLCHGTKRTKKSVPAGDARNYLPPVHVPQRNDQIQGLPGKNRAEKRLNARLAQQAYLEDKRKRGI
jgi:hypothetical protein